MSKQDNPEPTPLAEVLDDVANKLELIVENLKNNPNTKHASIDAKLIKEMLLTTLATSGRDDLDEQLIEKVIQNVLKSKIAPVTKDDTEN